VAVTARGLRVDDIAAKSYEKPILVLEIERNRRNFEPALDSLEFVQAKAIPISIISLFLTACRTDRTTNNTMLLSKIPILMLRFISFPPVF